MLVSSKRVVLVLLGYDKLRRVKKYQRREKKDREKERERAPTNIGAAQLTVPVAYVSIYPFGFVCLVGPTNLAATSVLLVKQQKLVLLLLWEGTRNSGTSFLRLMPKDKGHVGWL